MTCSERTKAAGAHNATRQAGWAQPTCKARGPLLGMHAVLLARPRFQRTATCLSAAALVLVATVASATVIVAMDLPALVSQSSHVVHGTVTQGQAQWAPDGRHIQTRWQVQVLDTAKGAPVGALDVITPGGVVGDIGQRVAGAPALAVQQEVLLFLAPGHGAFEVVGMAQGVWPVERAPDGSVRVGRAPSGLTLVRPRASDQAPALQPDVGAPPLRLTDVLATVRRLVATSGGQP